MAATTMSEDPVIQGMSGAAGAVTALLATFPLMTLSTRQATEVKKRTPSGAVYVPPQRSQAEGQRGPWAPVQQLLDLYSGLQPALIGTICSQGLYFYLYYTMRKRVMEFRVRHGMAPTLDVGPSLAIATLAGIGNVLVTNPIWVVVTRMQAAQKKVRASASEAGKPGPSAQRSSTKGVAEMEAGMIATARELHREAGALGFYRGLLPTLLMVCNPTLQYVLYEYVVKWYQSPGNRPGAGAVARLRPKLGPGEVFMLSAVAKAGATVATYPMMVVKSRLQAGGKSNAQLQYKGTWDAVRTILRTEGLGGFFGGVQTKLVQSVLAAALLFMVKEELARKVARLVRAYRARRRGRLG
ncbi:unnamed protein product [Pedinophyceae sp. YPF-701]|nr:unnamed protein product [Pedinophyceae sp. YPF-701]